MTRANLSNANLTDANLTGANLGRAALAEANLSGANIRDARLDGPIGLAHPKEHGLTKEQLYSTMSYKNKDLRGVAFGGLDDFEFGILDMSSWDLSSQDLRGARLSRATLTNTIFTNAEIEGADFSRGEDAGFNDGTGLAADQLYSTASYRSGAVRDVMLIRNHLQDWDLSNLDLTGSSFAGSDLAGALFDDSIIAFADFSAGFDRPLSEALVEDQLYSTTSYQRKDLPGINLSGNDLRFWDFELQNLTGASFSGSNLEGVNLKGANVEGVSFGGVVGLQPKQLFETTTYTNGDLSKIRLPGADLSEWDVSGTDLSGSNLSWADRTNANFENAIITFADLSISFHNLESFKADQLYSTASYKQKNLQGIVFRWSPVRSWNFESQNLTSADFFQANVIDANFVGANLSNARFSYTSFYGSVHDASTIYNQWTVFPDRFDPEAAGLTFVESAIGDFDADGKLGLQDINLLTAARHGSFPWLVEMFNIDSREGIDQGDLQFWIQEIKQTWIGDANLDGEFNSTDLVAVFQAGHYEDSDLQNSTWETGDWNGDFEFDTSDLVFAFQDGGFELGPRVAAHVVPEPSTIIITLTGVLALARRRR